MLIFMIELHRLISNFKNKPPYISKNQQNTTTIIGIDPGTRVMGYGVIRKNKKKPQLINFEAIKIHPLSKHKRLQKILQVTEELINHFAPDVMAIEAPFFGKNAQSMLKLGRAQGVAIAAGLNKDLQVYEYAPKKIKMSITGSGYASKKQVAGLLQQLLKFKEMPQFYDATDGLAVAVCHSFQQNNLPGTTGKKSKGYKSWKSFIENNPGRVND